MTRGMANTMWLHIFRMVVDIGVVVMLRWFLTDYYFAHNSFSTCPSIKIVEPSDLIYCHCYM